MGIGSATNGAMMQMGGAPLTTRPQHTGTTEEERK